MVTLYHDVCADCPISAFDQLLSYIYIQSHTSTLIGILFQLQSNSYNIDLTAFHSNTFAITHLHELYLDFQIGHLIGTNLSYTHG